MKIKLPLKNIIPILSSEFKTLADRPKYSVLDNTKLKKIQISPNNLEK